MEQITRFEEVNWNLEGRFEGALDGAFLAIEFAKRDDWFIAEAINKYMIADGYARYAFMEGYLLGSEFYNIHYSIRDSIARLVGLKRYN